MTTSNTNTNIVSKTNGFNVAVLCVILHDDKTYCYRSTTNTWSDDAAVSVEFEVGENSRIWCYNVESQCLHDQVGGKGYLRLNAEEFGQLAAKLGLSFVRTFNEN